MSQLATPIPPPPTNPSPPKSKRLLNIRVRRGFALMLGRNMERNIDTIIERQTGNGLARDARWRNAYEVADILAALEWIKQEAHKGGDNEPTT